MKTGKCNTSYGKKFPRNRDDRVDRASTCLFVPCVWAMSDHTNAVGEITQKKQGKR